jgi:hypothetical protein
VVIWWRSRNDAPLGISHGPKNERIVDWKSDTIAERGTKLTTVSAVCESVKDILGAQKIPMVDEKRMRPSDDQLTEAYEAAERWWTTLMARITPFRMAAADPVPASEDA